MVDVRHGLEGIKEDNRTHLSVGSDVLRVLLAQLLDGLDDGVVTVLLTHLLARVVRVAPGAVPVSRDGLGVEGHDHPELLAHALEKVARHPQLVPGLGAYAGAHL